MLELFLVMVLMVILFTMYWSFVAKGRGPSKLKGCQSNQLKIYIALDIYANDHAGRFPTATNATTPAEALAVLTPQYTVDTTVFTCPGSKDSPLPSGESFAQKKISYAYFMGRSRRDAAEVLLCDQLVDALPKAAGQAAFSVTGKSPGNNHEKSGGNFLYGDGHVEATPATVPFSLVIPPGVVLLNP